MLMAMRVQMRPLRHECRPRCGRPFLEARERQLDAAVERVRRRAHQPPYALLDPACDGVGRRLRPPFDHLAGLRVPVQPPLRHRLQQGAHLRQLSHAPPADFDEVVALGTAQEVVDHVDKGRPRRRGRQCAQIAKAELSRRGRWRGCRRAQRPMLAVLLVVPLAVPLAVLLAAARSGRWRLPALGGLFVSLHQARD